MGAVYRNPLLVVADGEHVRFVRPGADHALRSIGAADAVSAHKQSADLGAAPPGAAFHSDSSARHALAPRHDPHALALARFARTVACMANTEVGDNGCDALVIAAPAPVLAEIREHLDGSLAARIVGTLHKDLVKVPDDELWPHVQDWFAPVRRQTH